MNKYNSEGYLDLTAYEALKRIEKREKLQQKTVRKPLIYVASAYRGDTNLNTDCAKLYCRYVIKCGGIPFAPHLLFTQFLDDSNQNERKQGLIFGNAILAKCDTLWVFGNITDGMKSEIETAKWLGKPIKYFNTKCEEVQ